MRLENKEIKQILNDLAQYLNNNYGNDIGHPEGVVKYQHTNTTCFFTCWDCGAIVCINGRIYFINDDDGYWWIDESIILDIEHSHIKEEFGYDCGFSIHYAPEIALALIRLHTYIIDNKIEL